jgi:hypothetical protein
MAPATSLVNTLGGHYRQLLGRWNSRETEPAELPAGGLCIYGQSFPARSPNLHRGSAGHIVHIDAVEEMGRGMR